MYLQHLWYPNIIIKLIKYQTFLKYIIQMQKNITEAFSTEYITISFII